ncbi:hypothetical protein BH11MYX1_BH11MYX1_57430 [soil metagenome]
MVAIVVMACGKRGNDLEGRIEALTKIQAEVCACTDKTCADTAHAKYVALKHQGSKDDRPTEDQTKRYEAARRQLQDCWHTLNGTFDVGSAKER